jgi:hypothetical protein
VNDGRLFDKSSAGLESSREEMSDGIYKFFYIRLGHEDACPGLQRAFPV